MRGMFVAGAAVALGLLTSSAFATTIVLGPLNPATSDSASAAGKFPAKKGTAFTIDYTFSLTGPGDLSSFFTEAAKKAPTGTVTLWSGTPTSPGTIIDSASFAPSVTFDNGGPGFPEPAGAYFLQLAGTSHGNAAYSVVISTAPTVPEAATWTMLGLGFAALGFAGNAKRKRSVFAD
jgi:hypothetical protein